MTYRLQGVFSAIADPYRRQMLDYLAEAELSAGELADKFEISRPAVARHLRVLEECGLVVIRSDGRHRLHTLNPGPLIEVSDWLAPYERFWDRKLGTLKGLVEAAADRAATRQNRGDDL